jgi:predicted ATPase
MSDLVRKQRTMHIIEEQLALLSRFGPLLIIFEDIHWADPTSLELLGRILQRVAWMKAMVITNFRPEFVPPWLGLEHVTMLTLNQLDPRQVNELIEKTAADQRA